MAIKLYTTWWCGHCYRLKFQLRRAHIDFEEIDVEKHPDISRRIEAQTGGLRVVPTVAVGDALLVNPTVAEVSAAIQDARVPVPST